MENKFEVIKKWLGTGAIDIFGLPMAGKDTQGVRLAEALGAKLLGSGMIIRAMNKQTNKKYSNDGFLTPTNIFFEWVLPYILREDLAEFPLIYSSIGRWSGEEDKVMEISQRAGHEIKAAILLNISEADVIERYNIAKALKDNGGFNSREEREDDKNINTFQQRINEFNLKTMPVIKHYQAMGLLITVNGDQERDAVFYEIVDKLYQKAVTALGETEK